MTLLFLERAIGALREFWARELGPSEESAEFGGDLHRDEICYSEEVHSSRFTEGE